jgi:hypothetical protein
MHVLRMEIERFIPAEPREELITGEGDDVPLAA